MQQNIYARRCPVPEDEQPRSQEARAAAELALVRVVHHYGKRPEFVLLGGLVPALLCSDSDIRHAGTTDVDVQVDLEISSGAVNAVRLEEALRNAGFLPDAQNIWRWKSATAPRTVTVLGSTGSVGTQTVQLLAAAPERPRRGVGAALPRPRRQWQSRSGCRFGPGGLRRLHRAPRHQQIVRSGKRWAPQT